MGAPSIAGDYLASVVEAQRELLLPLIEEGFGIAGKNRGIRKMFEVSTPQPRHRVAASEGASKSSPASLVERRDCSFHARLRPPAAIPAGRGTWAAIWHATLGIPAEALQSSDLRDGSDGRPPLGLAIRSRPNDGLQLLFRKRSRPALRFETSRFLAEAILAPEGEHWLPATDTRTGRQKLQRAFAAELLSPIEALRDFVGGDFSPEATEGAAEYFGVSELTVKSHLANHGYLPPGAVIL